ncbi:MAG: hypothetical protein R2695_02895 [Acidimicrobiales bacterium]
MPSRQLAFPVFDADNHMYETPDALTKFLPDEYRGVVRYVQVDGRTKVAVKGLISEYIPNPTFEKVARPGPRRSTSRSATRRARPDARSWGRRSRRRRLFFDPAPRIELMDELGIDRAIMWPTLASLIEERLSSDPHATHAVIHALNEWMFEHWTFNFDDRIFPTPVITLPIVERAIEELEWVLERGPGSS